MRRIAVCLVACLASCSSSEGGGGGTDVSGDEPDAEIATGGGVGFDSGVRGAGGTAATGGATGTGGTAATGGASGTGGTAATGGASGSGGAAGTGGSGGGTPIAACKDATDGWVNITPPGVKFAMIPVVDPATPGLVYLGTFATGLFKSLDCGATWSKVNTGQGGSALDNGGQWTIALASKDVLYTVSGYGTAGIFKSQDGGVSFKQVLPAGIVAVTDGFIEKLTVEPNDHEHVLASFHAVCNAAKTTPALFPPGTKLVNGLPVGAPVDADGNWGCLAESKDGGATWWLTTSGLPWTNSDGGGHSMISANEWYYAANGYLGLWHTTTGGVSPDGTSPAWTLVTKANEFVNGGVYVTPDAKGRYTGGVSVLYSAGSDGVTWKNVTNPFDFTFQSLNGSPQMVQAGPKLIVATNGPRYYAAPISNGVTTGPFAAMDDSSITADKKNHLAVGTHGGNNLAYDSQYNVVYSGNVTDGIYRLSNP